MTPYASRILALALAIAAFRAGPVRAESFFEGFDSATPPALPTGWTGTNLWVTSSAGPYAGPNHARVAGAPSGQNAYAFGDQQLTSKPLPIAASNAVLSFQHQVYLSSNCGAQLQISIDGGGFTEIIAAGGQFLEGGYGALSGLVQPFSPNHWNGTAAYFTTRIRLPAAAAGLSVQLRWRVTDTAASPGQQIFWNVDSIELCDPACPANITIETDPDVCEKIVAYAAPASTVCDVNCDPPPGSAFPIGTTTVTCTAAAGPNCTFTVTVTESTAAGARNCAGAGPGCGGGMCGAAAAPLMPFTFLLLRTMRRKRRPPGPSGTGRRPRV